MVFLQKGRFGTLFFSLKDCPDHLFSGKGGASVSWRPLLRLVAFSGRGSGARGMSMDCPSGKARAMTTGPRSGCKGPISQHQRTGAQGDGDHLCSSLCITKAGATGNNVQRAPHVGYTVGSHLHSGVVFCDRACSARVLCEGARPLEVRIVAVTSPSSARDMAL